ncbi:tetratricopeptide repeat protein [Colwellia sp. RE-S-Sl-9]
MTATNKRYTYYLRLLVSSILIAGCSVVGSNNENQGDSETLGSFVKSSNRSITTSNGAEQGESEDSALSAQLLAKQLTRKERSEKLEKIYRSILTLEPNKGVRAQIQHRMVQLDIEKYEQIDVLENKDILTALVSQYKNLLTTYPNRPENEDIQYQLAKTYDLLAQPKESILTIEALLKNYPNTKHYAELHFRRAELYYNVEQYPLAYKAYQKVLKAENNENYRLNSIYMSGWSLFKLNRLSEADDNFITVLHQIADVYKKEKGATNTDMNSERDFSFNNVSVSHKSLAMDTQRVLSISLSQQQQSKSLVELLNRQAPILSAESNQPSTTITTLASFEHILFQNLAHFLLEKKLEHDAILTYKNYLDYAPHSFWSAQFSLALIDLYKQKGQLANIRKMKERFVTYYGLTSLFWQQSSSQTKNYVLPFLSDYSLAKSRRLYAYAQDVEDDKQRELAFIETATWLKKYIDVVAYSNTQVEEKTNLATQEYFLYAEANFEAKQYLEALKTYKMLAYSSPYINQLNTYQTNKLSANKINNAISVAGDQNNNNTDKSSFDNLPLSYINQESAYASIVTMTELLKAFEGPKVKVNSINASNYVNDKNQQLLSQLLEQHKQLNDLFIEHHGDDRRAKLIAVKAAEYAFTQNNIDDVIKYADFVLTAYQADAASLAKTQNNSKVKYLPKLDSIALKQVAIASQLKANIHFKFKHFEVAEQDYLLALNFVQNPAKKQEINELVAYSIYEQAKAQKALGSKLGDQSANELAIQHYLRLGKLVPNSKYRANAEFDAANLLLASQQWARAIPVLNQFSRQFKTHPYISTIPAKLALSYEKLENWSQAAQQLLVMVANENNSELKRESQYTAAEYFLKAGDTKSAITHFRTYAHQYPEPFAVAQEVRFKMSEFYRETNEPNKRYFWYRKIISFHKKQEKQSTAFDLSRSTYLASYAAFALGQAHQQTFNQTKLKVPLNQSLKRKQQAMAEAINYYQLVFKWQLAEFVPQANYSIGQIYRNLAADVMKSERPKDLDELALEEYEFLLEEIAYPFEEKAIEVHQANAERAWDNIYDQWVKNSLSVLAEIEPAKYDKFEIVPEVFDAIF